MIKEKKITLVIPVLNEEETIGLMLSCVPKFIDEVVIVDNGSVDKTAQICRHLGAQVICEEKKGYGGALKAGISFARGEIVVCMDGDNSYPLAQTEGFVLRIIDERCDFVSGQRIFSNGNIPVINRISNIFISWLIRICFRINLYDSQSGMFAFRREAMPKIIPLNRGMGFSQEIKLQAWLSGLKCEEIKIPYKNRTGGKSKFRKLKDSWMILGNLARLLGKYHGFV